MNTNIDVYKWIIYNILFSPGCLPGAIYLKTFEETDKQLLQFEKINLNEMDAVQLQNRMDTKFMFHLNQLPSVLHQMKDDYRVFEINNFRLHPYHTLYFDTDNWKLYLMHHNNKMNRFKVRFRTYMSSDLTFFEVKYKNNKNRTLKERIKVPGISDVIDERAAELLAEITPVPASAFHPKLWVNYSRITFVNKLMNERVTIDLNLNNKTVNNEKALNDLIVAEVKQARASTDSPFLKILKSKGIRSGSVSKYCMGVMFLNEEVKKNNFKVKLLAVNKIINQPKD